MIKTGLSQRILLAALFLVPLSACQETANLQGHYLAGGPPQEKQANSIELVLNLNGQGYWAKGDERVFIKWETKNKKIWLHTKGGGIVSGTLFQADTLEIMFPGTGNIKFKKVPQ